MLYAFSLVSFSFCSFLLLLQFFRSGSSAFLRGSRGIHAHKTRTFFFFLPFFLPSFCPSCPFCFFATSRSIRCFSISSFLACFSSPVEETRLVSSISSSPSPNTSSPLIFFSMVSFSFLLMMTALSFSRRFFHFSWQQHIFASSLVYYFLQFTSTTGYTIICFSVSAITSTTFFQHGASQNAYTKRSDTVPSSSV